MSSLTALNIAGLSMVLGVIAIIIVKPYIKSKTQSKFTLQICNIAFVIGTIIFISLIICMFKGKHINQSFTYTEYPIQKLTFSNIYFGNEDENECSINESYAIIEDPDEKLINVVIEEKEKYTVQWLFKIKLESKKYHVYLSKELYNRLKDGAVIYEK